MKHKSLPPHHDLLGRYGQMALVLQGGGALGAYQAGVYQALEEAGCEPDWVSGVSIGGINAAIIAGNEPGTRTRRLREFWTEVTSSVPWLFGPYDDEPGGSSRHAFNVLSAEATLLWGRPGFFHPRFPPAVTQPRGSRAALSVYDTSPLRSTLERLVDFDRINAQETRLSLGAVDIRLGDVVFFDNTKNRIGAEHVMASGALPPGFPPIEIDGDYYWDGGVVSNTPLAHVLEHGLTTDTLVFQVDLFSARGPLPRDLADVEMRQKSIGYSSRTRLNTDSFRDKHRLRHAIVELFEHLPAKAKQSPEIRQLRELGDDRAVAIVHLIYRRASFEGQAMDYEFSRLSMEEHWKAGLHDGNCAVRHPRWLGTTSDGLGIEIFDVTKDSVS